MLSDTDPLLPSCSEPYQLGLTCVPDRDHSRDAASAVGERDGRADDHAEQLVKPVRPTSKEFTKTWGFRRTTIAQRETPPDSVVQEAKRALARRSGRQAKRGHQASESVPTAKPGRGGRMTAPASLGSPKPPSETSADAGDPSEPCVTAASVPVRATEEPVETSRLSESKMPSGLSASEGATSSDQADSEELTLKELQERIRRRRKKDLMGPHRDAGSLRNQGEESSLHEATDGMRPGPSPAETGQNPVSVPKPSEPGAERAASPSGWGEQGGSPSKLSGQSHCPDSLYCICRQKHNDRFMICCDRCDEWFHGDCVGVSAAQGRRLERSGQEYTCPSCTQQKVTPALAPGPEGAQPEAGPSSGHSALPSPDTEEDCGGDQAIKGKIERATNPGEKRRIKIFQPLEDTSGLPQCMGPGCGKSALPDSVYCGAECIIRHAAAAMKSLTSVKEPAAKGQVPKRPAAKSAAKGQKRPLRERAGRRSLESGGRTEEDEASSAEEAAVEPNQTSPPWSRDHNCIAAKPENTTAIPSAVFYKAFGLEREARMKKELAAAQPKPPHSLPTGDGQSPTAGDPPSKRTKLMSQPPSSDVDTKQSTPQPNRGFTSVKRSPTQTFPSPPSHPPATGRPSGDASRLSKASCKVPGKPSTPQHPPPAPPSAAGPPSSTPAAPPQLPQSPPNLTVRHNARRSLVETLNKRVSDCDDLDVPERNVLKIAVGIEKELYGLFLSTGHHYKNKYRSIMFNLKDPKKKGLFYQVVMGKVTPFKLVRLSAEELSAKDMAGWTPREKAEASEASPRAWSGRLKAVRKLENSPVSDMDDSSPLPGDTCVPPATSSPSTSSAPERPGRSTASAPVNIRQASASVFNTMLTDTTAEHRTHLFNLNCRICTGRVSEEEEPDAKTLKTSDDEKDEPEATQLVEGYSGHDSSPAAPDSQMYIMESPASPDDPSSAATSSQPITIPAVACVVISGRDPRTVGYRPPVTPAITPPVTSAIAPPAPATVPPAAVPTVPSVSDSNQHMAPAPPPLPAPPPPAPKSILKPASSSQMRFFTSSGHTSIMDSHSSPNRDTAAFLSKQKVMWKGFINMQSIAKFVTKAYLVSGSCELLEEDLPDSVQIGGRISPDIVWDYVMKVKTSVTKELCLMRFHPASEEEEVAYISLFSYFNSRGRFGVVANNSHRVKDLYLIPLSAKAPIPSKLGPVEGPGLEANHPNLLLGLAICQKPKCPGAVQSEKAEEKRSRIAPGPPEDPPLPELPVPPSAAMKEEKDTAPNQDAVISTSPPGSPSSVSSSDSSSSFFSTSLLLQRLKPLAAPAPVTSISSKETSSSTAPAITPLQTILKTLFGKNKPESQGSQSPSEQNVVKKEVSPVPILDPVLQQFCRVPNEKVEGDGDKKINQREVELNSKTGGGILEGEFKVEADEDDRPYDPEEEYYPGMGGVVDEKEKPLDMEMERNVGMGNKVKKEYDRPYDPEEEYNPEICYWTEEDDDGDDRPYDLEEEYNSKIGPGEAKDDDDRPYDPEEEYNLGMGCGMKPAQKNQSSNLSEAFSDDEVAYDPEDDTIFEEVKGNFADSLHRVKGQLLPRMDSVSGSESVTLTEQRKMLEELNKQIEEQERQLAEQEEALRQQRAAVGESLAHFSVSDALMSPPLKPLITNESLLPSRNKELAKRSDSPVTDSRSLPSQSEDPWQAGTDKNVTSDGVENDRDAQVLAENAKSSKPDDTSPSPSTAHAESPRLESGSEVPTSMPETKMDSGILGDLQQESTPGQKMEKTTEPKNAVLQDSAWNVRDEKLCSDQIDCPEHFQTTLESKPIQKPLRGILRNKISHRSSETPKISCDSVLSKADSSECAVKSEEVRSPDFRGPKEMPRSSPFRSSRKSSPKRESPRLLGERDSPQVRCSSKFEATDARPSYRHRRGERRSDFPRRLSPSAGLVPRRPRPTSPMDPPSKFDQNRRSLPPNNIRPRGRSPDQFMDGYYPHPPLDVRDDTLQSPSLEFSGLRGPHDRPVDEGPRLNDSHGSQRHSRHSQIVDRRSPKPLSSVRRYTVVQCHDGSSYEHRMERDQGQTPRMFRENNGSSQARYLGPVREIGRQQPPSPPMAQSPSLLHPRLPLGQKRRLSENQNGPQHPDLKRHRGPPSSHFRGPQHNQDNFTGSVGHPNLNFEGQDGKSLERPMRRALLPTPADGPIFLPRLMGNEPDHHRKDWRHSPDMRSGVTELDSSECRDNSFGGYRHDDEEAQFPSRLQAERQQELQQEWNDSPLRNWERDWSREQERGCDGGIDEEKHWGEDYGHEPVRDRELPELGRRRHKVWSRRDRERSRIRDQIKDQKYDRHHPEEGFGRPFSREHGRHRGRDHGRGRSRNFQEGCNLRDRCRREEET